ncbi:uncharacterized mitochondrial protein-like protein [Tanacetum coccineum]
MVGDTPFDMGFENGIWIGHNGMFDQKLLAVVCSKVMKIFKGKGVADGGTENVYQASSSMHYACFTSAFALLCHPGMNVILDWISDLGASDHMSPHLHLFISVKTLKHPIIVHLPDGRTKTVTHVGQVKITPFLTLNNVFYDPLTNQIIVVGKGSKCLYICKPTLAPSTFFHNVSLFCQTHVKSIFPMSLNKLAYSNSVSSKQHVDIHTFHSRLGHTSISKLNHVIDCKHLNAMDFTCESCSLAKHHKLSFPKSTIVSSCAFELVHMDLWGTYKKSAINGAQYFFIIVDDYTRATWTYLKTIPYTPQQNGVVKRKHRHLLEIERAIRMPMKVIGWKTSYEKLHGIVLSYSHLRVIGYPPNSKGYTIYDLSTKQVFHSKDVFFEERIFPFKIQLVTCSGSTRDFPTFHSFEEVDTAPQNTQDSNVADEQVTTESVILTIVTKLLQTATAPSDYIPTRKSSRSINKPAWLKDFVIPKTSSFANATCTASPTKHPKYPLYTKNDFMDIPDQHIAFLANVFALTKPSPYSHASKISSTKMALDQKFTIKDLGLAQYFLGIEICKTAQASKPICSTPTDLHMQAGLHLLRYLNGSDGKGLFYLVQPHLHITGFFDVDWTACLMTRRAMTGYCIFLEAEYRAMAVTTCEIMWLNFLLKDLHVLVKLPITLFCDNKSAQQLAANPYFHDRSKHLDMNCHFTREKIQESFLQTAFIPTSQQFADVMAKALYHVQHSLLVDKLGITDHPT